MELSVLSFCGVDESVDVDALAEMAATHPYVEWGINLCPHRSGVPGFPSDDWIERLHEKIDERTIEMEKGDDGARARSERDSCVNTRLCAVLHEEYTHELLNGDTSYVKALWDRGFTRIELGVPAEYYPAHVLERAHELQQGKNLRSSQPTPPNGVNIDDLPLIELALGAAAKAAHSAKAEAAVKAAAAAAEASQCGGGGGRKKGKKDKGKSIPQNASAAAAAATASTSSSSPPAAGQIDAYAPLINAARALRRVATACPQIEFVVPVYAETSALIASLFADPLPNVAFLYTKAGGDTLEPIQRAQPPRHPGIAVGYSGGFSPASLRLELSKLRRIFDYSARMRNASHTPVTRALTSEYHVHQAPHPHSRSVWVRIEAALRGRDGRVDFAACQDAVAQVQHLGLKNGQSETGSVA